ncbi:energy transducer TonB [Sphingomonas sp. LHG3406-1]|uniref:energy transducer TonB n=1 Tax=Sphingomonas sp. LHG3406-1 TaxID=2804617 RepID=UPI002623F2EA|nr:energy transducer TonB [Sphingomonas sp. LHG3406-1]
MPWQPSRDDRKKSLALVLTLHLGLGAALILGLRGDPMRRVAEDVTMINVPLPPPMPPEKARPPQRSASAARERAGAEDLAARPAPVVLPPPVIPLPTASSPRTADEAAPITGNAQSAGAGSQPGPGRGAGGNGDGTGGGGDGGSGAGGLGNEARLLSGNLTRSDYRRIRSFGALRGQAVLGIEVSAGGRLTRCQPISSSGNGALDEELCRLLGRTFWEPARSRAGTPVPVALRYVATWDRN